MNLDYDDARITCSNCGTRYFVEVGMSPCPNCNGRMGGYQSNNNEDTPMGWYSPEPECTADVGVMGHLGCNNPNCSCKDSTFDSNPIRDYQGNVNPTPVFVGYSFPNQVLKHKGLIHETDKAKLFAIKKNKQLYEIWIPKSCVLGLTDKKVTVSHSFYYKSVVKQIREQGGII